MTCCKCCCKKNSAEYSSDFRRCYCCSNFRTALYTIWLHRKHNVILTLLQIILPIGILMSSNCIHASLLPHHEVISKWTKPPAMNETVILESIKCKNDCINNPWIFFNPENEFTRSLVNLSLQYFYGPGKMSFTSKPHFLRNHSDGFSYGLVKNLMNMKNYFLGVVRFIDSDAKLDPELNVPQELNFKVYLAPEIPYKPQPASMFSHDGNDIRHYMPLMGIELALSKAYAELIASKVEVEHAENSSTTPMPDETVQQITSSPQTRSAHLKNGNALSNEEPMNFDINIQQFPYPPHNVFNTTADKEADTIWIIPTALVLGFTVVILTFSGAPVSHKESGFKLELHMMGMSTSLFWGGWIFNQFLIQLVTIGLQTYLLFTPICGVAMVSRGSHTLWLLVLVAYNMASLSFMAFVSAFFKRSIMCTYVGATIWLLSFYFVMIHWPTYTSFWFRLISCLIPNSALLWAVTLLINLGGDWDSIDLFLKDVNQEGISLIYVIIFLFVDSLLYFFLIPYVDYMRPGPYEVIQPWNYFFEKWVCRRATKNEIKRSTRTKSALMGIESKTSKYSSASRHSKGSKGKVAISDSEIKLPSVEFVDLTKKFKRAKDVYAIDNVNFKVYPGKITVLLGHSGSGKTTLLRLLCGEYYPTKGTAYVLGLDVRHHRHAVTHLMSVCFERNLLSNYLTALEHLILIGILKGMSRKEAIERAQKLLVMLEITSIKNSRIHKLLEHEKRLLSVALALIGKSPVIVMDEVTDGLEPDTKRIVWNTLKGMRNPDCTIIIFTSNMEEAYYLGDRIAIMSKGKIVGSGTLDRLEKLFGTGYHLKILLEPGRDKNPVFDFVSDCIESTEELESRLVRLNKAIQLVDQDEEQFILPTASDTVVDEGASIMHYLTLGFLKPKNQQSTVSAPNKTAGSPTASVFQAPQAPEVTIKNDVSTSGVSTSKKPDFRKSQVFLVSDPGAFRKDPKKILFDDDESPTSSTTSLDEPVELILLLPKSESKYFKKLFSYLETDSIKKNFGILSYRIKSYTMTQAFDEVDEYVEIEKIESTFENQERRTSSTSAGSNKRVSSTNRGSLKQRESYINEKFKTVVHDYHDKGDIAESPLPFVPRGTSCCSKFCRGFQKILGLLTRRLKWTTGGWIYALVQMLVPILLLLFLMQATNDYYTTRKNFENTPLNLSEVFPKAHVPIIYKHGSDGTNHTETLVTYYKSQLGKSRIDELTDKKLDETEFYKYIYKLDKNRKKADWNSTTLYDYLYNVVVIGVDFRNELNPIGFYSPAAFHGPSLSTLALINTRLAVMFPHHKFFLNVTSHPMQYKKPYLELLRFSFTDSKTSDFEQCFIFAILMGYGFFIFTSGFTAQPTTERLNLFKRLQLNTGVSSFTYWFCLFIVDFTMSLALGALILIIMWFFGNHRTFSNAEFAKYFSLHWILASYTCILTSYIFSFYFRRGSTAYFAMLSINQVFGLFPFTLALTLKEASYYIARPVTYAMHFLQPFTIPAGFFSLANLAVRNNLCYTATKLSASVCNQTSLTNVLDKTLKDKYRKYCCKKTGKTILHYITLNKSFIENWGNIDNFTMTFLALIFHAVVATFVLFVIEKKINLRRLCCRKKTSAKESDHVRKLSITGDERLMAKYDQSESVRQEKVEVENSLKGLNGPTHEFVVHEITQWHKNRQLLTDISIVAEPGELCCIVGPSGSGKSKLFRVLANETYASDGDVYYSGLSLANPMNQKFLCRIGYSLPGKDFVFRRISGKQVVRLFGRLRGVPEGVLKEHVKFWLNEFGLTNEASGNCEHFSDSTKQRLSLASCFIGDPEIVILDDPLPHLDPEGRLQFWTVIDKLLSQDKIIFMMSSSLENVQHHCSKIAVLINGALRHVTSPYKLAEDFGLGTTFTYVVYLKPENEQNNSGSSFEQYTELKARIEKDIPKVVLQEELHCSLKYHIEECEMQLSDLFGLVDAISVDFVKIMKEYELRETSMEDIYYFFALKQNKYRVEPSTLDTFCLTYC